MSRENAGLTGGGSRPVRSVDAPAWPAYLSLHSSGELAKRAERAWARLRCCTMCSQNCRVDRLAGELGVCRTGAVAQVASYGPDLSEETALVGRHGSGAIFFAPRRMIAVDTNILVYAHREDLQWFDKAVVSIRSLAESSEPWAIPWPCIYEFLAIVTHPRIFMTPTPVERAVDQIEAWLESPSVVLVSEGPGHWGRLADLVLRSRAEGPLVHDARVAALCLANGVSEVWSADRDFGRFPGLKVRNPLVSR